MGSAVKSWDISSVLSLSIGANTTRINFIGAAG